MLLDATNKEQLIPINTGRGNTFVTIQKGQVIYGRFKYQENFLLQVGQTGIIDRILKRLEKVHKLVDRQTYSHYTVVTIKNYDVLTKMDRLIDRQCTGNRQAIDTYKSVKSVKTDKTVGLPNQKTTPLMEITYPSIYAICQETNIFPDTARAFLASLIKQVLADGVKVNSPLPFFRAALLNQLKSKRIETMNESESVYFPLLSPEAKEKKTPSRESGLKPKTRKKLWAALNKISTLEVAKQRGGNK